MYFSIDPRPDLLACGSSRGGGGGGWGDGIGVDWGPKGDPWASVDPVLAEAAAELEGVAAGGGESVRSICLSLSLDRLPPKGPNSLNILPKFI